jgi:hypothetical protein
VLNVVSPGGVLTLGIGFPVSFPVSSRCSRALNVAHFEWVAKIGAVFCYVVFTGVLDSASASLVAVSRRSSSVFQRRVFWLTSAQLRSVWIFVVGTHGVDFPVPCLVLLLSLYTLYVE